MSTLIYFHKQKFERDVKTLEYFKKDLEKLFSEFNSIGLGDLNHSEIQSLLFATEAFLFNKIMKDKPKELGGMRLSEEKLFELIEKPDGYFSVIKSVADFNAKWSQTRTATPSGGEGYFHYYKTTQEYLRLFEIDEDLEISIKDSLIQKLKKSYEVYVESEKAIATYNFAVGLEALVKETKVFDYLRERNTASINKFFDELLLKTYNPEDCFYNISFLKRLDK